MPLHGRILLSQGDQVAGYVIDSYVARGGMAVVYRARDLGLGRWVALKLIAPELAEDSKFRQRFIRESEMAAAIDHPNILPIYQAGESEGLLYIAMRYVDGQDLGSLLAAHGALPPDVAMPLFTQVAAALDTAHSHGLVHRDVKPGNILVARSSGSLDESHVYLTDFGLTKKSTSLSGFTTAGHFIGTIAYVAPEQIAGRTVTERADVYAMGCVLYEALAGRPPFERDDDAAMLWAHMSDAAPRLSEVRPELPAEVDAVLDHAMAKDPADRAPSCRSVIAELRAAFRSVRPPVRRVAPPAPPTVRWQAVPPAGPGAAEAPSPAEPLPPHRAEARAEPAEGAGVWTDAADPRAQVPAAAGPVRGGPGRRGPRSGRRGALAAVGVVLLGAAAVGYLVERPHGSAEASTPYTGTAAGAGWLSFDKPKAWLVHPTTLGVCFCTDHLGPALESGLSSTWEQVDRATASGAAAVQGMYVRRIAATPPTTAAAARDLVLQRLNLNAVRAADAQPVSVGGEQGWRVDGTVQSRLNPDSTLSFRYFVLVDGRSTDHLVQFTRDDQTASFAATADRVLGSTRLVSG